MNDAYQIDSIGTVVFLFLLSGIPWTIYTLMNPQSYLRKSMLIIVIFVMIAFMAIKAIPATVKFSYIYPFLGGFFLPEFFSSILGKVSNKLQENAEQENESPEEEQEEKPVKMKKKVKQTESKIKESYSESEMQKDFVEINDEDIERRKRVKRKTTRKRELNIDE